MAQPPDPTFVTPATLGGRIQAARKRLGMTQTLLARATGASQPQVAKWENGQKTPPGDVVVALAQVLQVPLSWLEGGGGPPPDLGEAELESLMKARLGRLQIILGGHANLSEVAGKSGLTEVALKLALEGQRTLTLDEASRIAQATSFSLSWLLYGEKQTPFSLDLESLRKEEAGAKAGPPKKHESAGRVRRLYNMDAILERRHRFVTLLWDEAGTPPISELSGVPQAVIDAYLEGSGDLSMEQIEQILGANGVSLDWVMSGEEPSFLNKVAAQFENLSEVIRSYHEQDQGFFGWLHERRGKRRLEWMLRYVRLKPLLEWVLTPEIYRPLTLSQCELELAKRLDPKGHRGKPLDGDALEIAEAMLAYAGLDWLSQKRPDPELLTLAYQHARKRSIAGLEPDEAFIEELRRRVAADLADMP